MGELVNEFAEFAAMLPAAATGEALDGEVASLPMLSKEELGRIKLKTINADIGALRQETAKLKKNVNMGSIAEYLERQVEFEEKVAHLDEATKLRDERGAFAMILRKKRLDAFMAGFSTITLKLKEMYQMITLGGDLSLSSSIPWIHFRKVLSLAYAYRKELENISNLGRGKRSAHWPSYLPFTTTSRRRFMLWMRSTLRSTSKMSPLSQITSKKGRETRSLSLSRFVIICSS